MSINRQNELFDNVSIISLEKHICQSNPKYNYRLIFSNGEIIDSTLKTLVNVAKWRGLRQEMQKLLLTIRQQQ
jgi:hypothetical protein